MARALCTNAKPKFSDGDVLALFDAVIALLPPPPRPQGAALTDFIGACEDVKTKAADNLSDAAKNLISGENGLAAGNGAVAYAKDSTAMGLYTAASGLASTAMGTGTTASGNTSTAMGLSTTALGYSSTAMGWNTRASGQTSTAMGYDTKASGNTSTAMGFQTVAEGPKSTAMGFQTRVGLLKAINDQVGGILAAAQAIKSHYNTADTVDTAEREREWLTRLNALKVVYDAATPNINTNTEYGAQALCKIAKPKFSNTDVRALFDAVIALNPPQVDIALVADADAAAALTNFITDCDSVKTKPTP